MQIMIQAVALKCESFGLAIVPPEHDSSVGPALISWLVICSLYPH